MDIEIFPIKKLPPVQRLGGDYYYTQSSMILAMFADGETVLKNYNTGIDTGRTIEFLQKSGCTIDRMDESVTIKSNGQPILPDERFIIYDGELYPLSLIIGLLTGLNKACTVQYSENLNQDMIDRIVETFNKNGIDLSHEADSRSVIIRAATNLPVKTKVFTSNSCVKNSLIMFSIVSGISVIISEMSPSAAHLESVLGCFGLKLEIDEPGTKLIEDPNDPRRKIRVSTADYKRQLTLSSNSQPQSAEIIIPCSSDSVSALMTLAVLLKKEISLENVLLNLERNKFLDHLKAIGSDVSVSGRSAATGWPTGSIKISCKNIKARKFAGEHTSVLIDDVPFMALMAVLGSGTTIIRDVGEFNEWGLQPLQEIADNFEKMGIKCGILEDGLIIEGTGEVNGADFGPFNNSKIALIFYIAALAGQGISSFVDFEIVNDYYPDMVTIMKSSSKHRMIVNEGV
jgi:5-enolpyruvylshikimate-3-phosphate synthase